MKIDIAVVSMGIIILALLMRLPGLGTFMTVDEENWMLRSAGFWHELFRKGNPGGTFITTHPGATTMLLSGAGIFWQERRLRFDIDTSNLRYFRVAATLPIAITTSVLIGMCVALLARLLGTGAAAWAGFLLSLDPYLTGMSQISHVDALLSLFMLNALLSFFLYHHLLFVQHMEKAMGSTWGYGLIAGVMSGAALATKMLPALWLFVVFVAMLIVQNRRHLAKRSKGIIRAMAFIIGVAIITLYVLWPALWVKDDILRSFQKDVPSVITQEHVALEESEDPVEPLSFYVRSTIGRTTPFVLLVAAGVCIAAVRAFMTRGLYYHQAGDTHGFHPPSQDTTGESPWRNATRMSPIAFAEGKATGDWCPGYGGLRHPADGGMTRSRGYHGRLPAGQAGNPVGLHIPARFIAWMVLYAMGFLVVITWAAKKADRYALPSHVVWPVLAGIGLAVAFALMRGRFGYRAVKIAAMALAAAIIGQVILLVPYAISYESTYWNVTPNSQQGWGEGLDQAALWLNTHPVGEELVVASWYPGVMRTYFNGETMSLSSRNDDRVGYVVTYRNMMGRGPDDIATNVLEEFKDRSPVFTVIIQGKEYAWVYEQLGMYYFDKHIGELIGDIDVGQTVPVTRDGWDRIDIGMSNFSGRTNTEDVILHVREDVDAVIDMRTVTKNAQEVIDSDWNTFEFEPIQDSKGNEYYVSLTSPDSFKGNAVTVRYSDKDIKNGQMVLRKELLKEGEKNSDFVMHAGDIAYRL